jgi:hypothetical protein
MQDENIEWRKLTDSEQKEYIEKASYLVDRGYIQNLDVEEAALRMYMSDKFGDK